MPDQPPRRPILTKSALTAALRDRGCSWTDCEVVDSTGSTNSDLAERAHELPAGFIRAANEQWSGRGRLGRVWSSPAGASVSFSVLLRPAGQPAESGWLPLLTGLAVVSAISELGAAATLKWPNDVLLPSGKVAGILAERVGPAVVVGVGINTAMTAAELPVPEATSLRLAGVLDVDPNQLVAACVTNLEQRFVGLRAAAGDPERSGLRQAYEQACSTLGQEVSVRMSDQTLIGSAVGIDREGHLVVRADGRDQAITAGDVTHLRTGVPGL